MSCVTKSIAVLICVSALGTLPEPTCPLNLDAGTPPIELNHDEPHWGVETPQARLDYIGSIA